MKKSKIKDEVKKLRRNSKHKDKKLSKHEENKSLLSAIKEKREEREDDLSNEKTLSRTFICKCGCEVRLSGNIDLNIIKCSKCLKEKDCSSINIEV